MTLAELIGRFRTLANDKVEPYFWSDDEIAAWLNDALQEAAVRGRLLHRFDAAVPVVLGQAVVALPERVFEVDCVVLERAGARVQLPLLSPEERRLQKDDVDCAVLTDTDLLLFPAAVYDGTLWVSGYRLPVPLVADDDVPEILDFHHVHLLQWVLHQAFAVPDAEVFDAQRSAAAEFEFTRYFGLRPDSDLRRITREDVPQSVKPFWV
ncbi:hypothetical protein QDY71_10215 [Kingella negevensis]|uniref:Uncharacterized protein n=1 Tax=Kingella negevensis TaxID=1522312 RepID=A0A238HHM1_9NEIS|nr:hypothetical protein [Kingella negevensis]MDK4680839.1 hypothetical protein [Kingella negevensis]MDK4681438.1 hypothetical protein [Kingella negevensis]MDK4684279.1 hypothetical protein [Kingella negevensis]MDK4691824.1 hypothetical protein [Kingella negevensis]MDK4693022.1 hypothetical protein [Kingella negevensis]